MEIELKKCTNCCKEFPKTKDYFFKKTIKQQNKNGLAIYYSFRSICKNCSTKKTESNRIKKRCKEMNCSVAEYKSTISVIHHNRKKGEERR